MSQKFSFVVEIKGGKPVGHVFKKEDAQAAKELFEKVRAEGKEAYYFQSPNHDKRCKSEAQMSASAGTSSEDAPAAKVEAKVDAPSEEKPKKNSIMGF